MIEMLLSQNATEWTDGKNILQVNYWGTVSFLEGERSFEDTIAGIATMFVENGEKAFSSLEGNFVVILTDGKKYYLVNSIMGGPLSLYYAKNGDKIVCSDKLWLLLEAIERVEPCEKSIQAKFIKYGFLMGEETLIKGVNKVPVGTYLVLDMEGNIVKDEKLFHMDTVNFPEKVAVRQYQSLVSEIIRQGVSGHDKIAVTLSSGFDSNFILWNLRKLTDKKIDAFCIGGKKGRNEISKANILASLYKNVMLHSKLVDSNTLLRFEEIVWRLEGAIYERGIFLQYELAKLVSQMNYVSIMEGDGADQVMRNNFKIQIQEPKDDIWHMRPDVALRYIVLPKNMRMMYSFGVLPRYPYLNRQIMDCLASLKELNGTTKVFHKKVVKDSIGELFSNSLSDSGGTTHFAALLENTSVCSQKCEEWNLISYTEAQEMYGTRGAEDFFDKHFRELYIHIFYKIFIYERKEWIKNEEKNS